MLIFIGGKLTKNHQNNCKMMVIKVMLSLPVCVLGAAFMTGFTAKFGP